MVGSYIRRCCLFFCLVDWFWSYYALWSSLNNTQSHFLFIDCRLQNITQICTFTAKKNQSIDLKYRFRLGNSRFPAAGSVHITHVLIWNSCTGKIRSLKRLPWPHGECMWGGSYASAHEPGNDMASNVGAGLEIAGFQLRDRYTSPMCWSETAALGKLEVWSGFYGSMVGACGEGGMHVLMSPAMVWPQMVARLTDSGN